MNDYRLTPAREEHMPQLMSWLPDRERSLEWGGLKFRYPFTAETFREDTLWEKLPGWALVNGGDELLGFGQFYDRIGRCHLGRLIISPDHRGLGLGETLVRELCRLGCPQLDASECSLFVLQKNTRAKSLYRKLGFTLAEYPEQHDWLAGCDYMIAPAENFIGVGNG